MIEYFAWQCGQPKFSTDLGKEVLQPSLDWRIRWRTSLVWLVNFMGAVWLNHSGKG
jgi:hypothetical protein